MGSPRVPGAIVYTVGHSTRSIEDFLAILAAHRIKRLIDVRTVPRSARNPQFGQEALRESLAAAGIAYRHAPALGGLRHARRDSVNRGWRNESFRGYADYMQTPAFEAALADLIRTLEDAEDAGDAEDARDAGDAEDADDAGDAAGGRRGRTAIMCAEALPWRCHRSLISDALSVRGIRVEHITSALRAEAHHLTPFARVEGVRITYPEPDALF